MSVPLPLTMSPSHPQGSPQQGFPAALHTQPLVRVSCCSALPSLLQLPLPRAAPGQVAPACPPWGLGTPLQWQPHLQQEQLSWSSSSDPAQGEVLRNPKVLTSLCTCSPASSPDGVSPPKHLQHFSTPLLSWIRPSKTLRLLSNFTKNLNGL